MKKALLAAAAVLRLAALAQPAQAQRGGDKIDGSYICVFNSQVSRGSAQAEANRAAAAVGARVEHVYSVAIRGFAANMAPQAVERIKGQQPQHRLLRAGQVVTVVPVQAQGGGVSGTAVSQRRKRRGVPPASAAARPAPSPRRW